MPPYRMLYRLGFTPWEQTPGPALLDRILDGADPPPAGRALDIGCGTGRDAVHLAGRGWQVTGVDFMDAALAKARERAARAGADVQWLAGDVTRLEDLGLEPGYSLIYDMGCIQGLEDGEQVAAARGISALAAPGATLLFDAFKRGRRPLMPRGMDREHVVALFEPGWELVETIDMVALTERPPPLPIRKAQPRAYRLVRRA
jgi:SAM-dependent methyltransferase